MAYQYTEIRQFTGYFAQANSFGLPDGAMERALNVVLSDDNVISKVRGFYSYYAPVSGTLNNLFFYQEKLMAAYTAKWSYYTDTGSAPNETGTLVDLTGATFTVTAPRVSRSMEASGNLYATSDNGIMKIDAYNGKIFNAGVPPGLDIRGNFLAANGPVPGDSEVGYRVLFGRRDANDNLLLGAPSDILTLTNSPVTGLSWARSGAGPTWTVTVTSPLHNLAASMSVTVTSVATPSLDGAHTIALPGADPINTFSFDVSIDPGASGSDLSYVVSRAMLLEFTIPQGITAVADLYFFQIYRTTTTSSALVEPENDFRLVEERSITTAELTARFINFVDEVDEVLVEFAPELYTNPNSREGELQANARPPLAADLALFQNYAFYGNCVTRHALNLDIVDSVAIVNAGYIEIKVDATTRRYVARDGVSNRTVKSQSVASSGGPGKLQITYVNHGFIDGFYIYISTITGSALTAGYYYVVNKSSNTFEIALTSGGTAIAYTAETSLYFQGVTNGTYPIFQVDATSSSLATQLRNTAQGLVKAINRDPSSLTFANYTSGIIATPGKMRFTGIAFTGTIYVRAETLAIGLGFAPQLPDSFSVGPQVASRNDQQPNGVYISKVGESEAVPVINFLLVGSRNKDILRILPLQDSVIILKEDGVFKITGTSPSNFQVTQIDNTVFIIAASSAALLANQVYFLANQGICVATDSSVEILSRRIENVIESIVGNSAISAQTYAIGYESDRTYRISTIQPDTSTQDITYTHNTINDTWTQADQLFQGGVVGPNNKLYLINGNVIYKERKYANRLDYVGQNYAVTVTAVASGSMSATITSSARTPLPGDVILKSDIFSRIKTVTSLGGSSYTVTFRSGSNLVAADAVNLYARIVSEVAFAPFHAGQVGRDKQFSQLQFHTRSPSITRMVISFQGPIFGGSEETIWDISDVSTSGGWGEEPWGFFAWGQPDGITNLYTTQPAPPIRLYVPLFQQRSEFIQTILLHQEGGEGIEIQAMSWAVRGYGERTSK